MSHDAQCFSEELAALVDRYREEADLTYVEIIGILEIEKAALLEDAIESALIRREQPNEPQKPYYGEGADDDDGDGEEWKTQ